MVISKAATVTAYLAELPPERRKVIAAVRKVIKANLPKGYVERMNWGMICYEIPFAIYPETYNKQPLCYAGLAAQKNNFAVYLMGVYGGSSLEKKLRDAFLALGKKPDMGKACVRFKSLAELPLETVGEIIAAVPVAEYIRIYEASRGKGK